MAVHHPLIRPRVAIDELGGHVTRTGERFVRTRRPSCTSLERVTVPANQTPAGASSAARGSHLDGRSTTTRHRPLSRGPPLWLLSSVHHNTEEWYHRADGCAHELSDPQSAASCLLRQIIHKRVARVCMQCGGSRPLPPHRLQARGLNGVLPKHLSRSD